METNTKPLTFNLPHDFHLGIIMDGNGRWAKLHNLPRIEGHKKGALVAQNLIIPISNLGIKHLTLFAFSTENWKRSQEEVGALMSIFEHTLSQFIYNTHNDSIRFRIIGNRNSLPQSLLSLIQKAEQSTAHHQGMNLYLALNHGGKDDIVSTTRNIALQVAQHKILPEHINEKLFHSQLQLHSAPSADIILRTGGEKRISNFLLWQAAYSELFFVDTFWPDVTINTITHTLELYKKRNRRYGNTI
jgi:undecaprenyl diphosphate synthase